MTQDMQIEKGNYCKIHNKILENLPKPKFSGRQWSVIVIVIRFTYGFHKKETKLTSRFLSEKTYIGQLNISKVIQSLIKMNVLKGYKEGRYWHLSFNKYSHTWKISQKRLKPHRSKTTKKLVGSDSKLSRKRLKKIKVKSHKTKARKSQHKPRKTSKDNIKITLKITIAHVKIFWNLLARWQKEKKVKIRFIAILHPNKVNRTLDGTINKRIEEHSIRVMMKAILNYHRYLMLPGKAKKFWSGYSWPLQTFLSRGKDYVGQFKDWEFFINNHINKEYLSQRPKPLTVSAALTLIKREQTTDAMIRCIEGLDKEQWIEFEASLKNDPETDIKYIRVLYGNATKILKERRSK